MAVTRRIRTSRLMILVLTVLALGSSAVAVWRYQVSRKTDSYLEQARLQREADNKESSRQLYATYLGIRPKDAEALAEYAAVTESIIEETRKRDPAKPVQRRDTAALIDGYEKLLTVAPDMHEERWKLSKLYIQHGDLAPARTHLRYLTEDYEPKARAEAGKASKPFDPPYSGNPEYWVRLADIEFLEGRNVAKTIECLRKAVEQARPAEPAVYLRLAALILEDGNTPQAKLEADRLIEGMVARYELSPAARKARGQYQLWLTTRLSPESSERLFEFEARKRTLRADARADLEFAAKSSDATDPDLIGSLAELAANEGDLKRTRELLTEGLKTFPKNARLRFALANCLGATPPPPAEFATVIGSAAQVAEANYSSAARGRVRDELRLAVKDISRQDPFLLDVIDRLLDLGETDTAKAFLSRIKAEHREAADAKDAPYADYFQARLWMLDGNWPAALPLLESAAPPLEKKQGFGARVWLAIAECHALSGNADGELAAAVKAVRYEPNLLSARYHVADALLKLGRYGPAAEAFAPLAAVAPKCKPKLCEALFRDTVGRPEKDRDWRALEAQFGSDPLPTEVALVRVAMLRKQNKLNPAERALRDAIARSPKDLPLRLALFEMKAAESVDAAARVLTEAETAVGDHPDIRVARLGLLLRSPVKPEPPAVEAFANGAESFYPAGRYKVYFTVGTTLADLGHADRSGPFIQKACDALPFDLNARVSLFDVALATKNVGLTTKSVEDIKRLEGADGPTYVVCKLIKEIGEMKTPEPLKLTEMRDQAEIARSKRDTWPRVYKLLGDIQDLKGNKDDALSNYMKAIDLGDRSRPIVLKTYALLKDRGQFDQANQLLLGTGLAAGISRDEIQRVVAYNTAASDPQAALKVVPVVSTNYMDHLTRAQLLQLVNQPADAEAAFRRAIDLSQGKAPEAWLGLIRFLSQTGRPEIAQAAYTEAAAVLPRHTALFGSKAVVPLTLGLCREAMNDVAGAEKHYVEAAALAPENSAVLRQLSGLYNRTGRRADADRLYKDMTAEKNPPALRRLGRRMLALTLTARPDGYSHIDEALALLDQNLKDSEQVEDRRARAFCLAVDPLRRDEAKRLLLETTQKFAFAPEDNAMLARIYMEDKQYQEALKYLTQAVRDPMPSAEHLALLAKVQLLLGYTANAASTVKQLKAVAPASWETASEEARLLARTGDKAGAARRLLDTNVARTPGEITGRIAPFLEEIGCSEYAEKALVDDLAKATGPAPHVPLTAFYLRTGQFEKAVTTALSKDGEQCPPGLTSRLLSAAVYARPRTSADPDGAWAKTVAEVTKIVADKEARNPNNVDILYAKAELADAAGKYAEALTLYERCLDLKSDGDVYLNNTAVMLALLKKDAGDRAVKLAEKVISLRGPRPEFLDTRGLCHLAAGNTKKAINDFTLAAKFEPKAVYYYHLAIAQDRAEYPLLSNAALTEAEKKGLNGKTYKDLLHPLEWPVYEALAKKRKK